MGDGVMGQKGALRVLGANCAQRIQQPRDVGRAVEAGLVDGPVGQEPDRVIAPGGVQIF